MLDVHVHAVENLHGLNLELMQSFMRCDRCLVKLYVDLDNTRDSFLLCTSSHLHLLLVPCCDSDSASSGHGASVLLISLIVGAFGKLKCLIGPMHCRR